MTSWHHPFQAFRLLPHIVLVTLLAIPVSVGQEIESSVPEKPAVTSAPVTEIDPGPVVVSDGESSTFVPEDDAGKALADLLGKAMADKVWGGPDLAAETVSLA